MACHKIKYRDKIAATMALISCWKKVYRKADWSRREKRIYYCNECKAWHLTSK